MLLHLKFPNNWFLFIYFIYIWFFSYLIKMLMFILQVAASTNREVDAHIPNYPNLPPQLICQLHNVTMHVRIKLIVQNFRKTFLCAYTLNLLSMHLAGRCWNRWSICSNDSATSKSSTFLLFAILFIFIFIFYSMSWHYLFSSKSKRRCICCLQNWVLPASNQPTTFAKHWLQVIPALMEDFLFLEEQLKKSSLLL